MTTQPIPFQPYRAHPHPRARPPIPLTVMPAHAGIQCIGSCGVRS